MTSSLLDLDPGLGFGLDLNRRAAALRSVRCPTFVIGRGPWHPPEVEPEPAGQLGLLVLEGLLVREVQVTGGRCVELLGPGDVLRPWDDDGDAAPLPVLTAWRVLEPARLAILDRNVANSLDPYPEIVAALMARTLRRSSWLATLLAIAHQPRVDVRLLVLFWHLADRWGTVESAGVTLPLRLTHGTLGALIGARRPSVTRSMRHLLDTGVIALRTDGGWVLPGEANAALERLLAAGRANGNGGTNGHSNGNGNGNGNVRPMEALAAS